MSLIPFILDLADELHEFNRCLATGMDVDDFGFGIYPHELQQLQQQQQQLLRRPRAVSQLYWLPNSKQQQRHHPYNRSKLCCNKIGIATAAASEKQSDSEREYNTCVDKESPNTVTSKSAYSVVNKNGFQVSMNVKQFAPNELTVKTIDNCIVVEGRHDDKEDGHGVISRQFIRKYMLPKGYDPNEVLSTLSSDGILTVKAPPPPATKTDEPLERIVDIQQTGPAHLSVKEASKEHQQQQPQQVKATSVQPTATQQQQTAELQKQQKFQQQQKKQAQDLQQKQVEQHNGDANMNEFNNESEETESQKPTSAVVSNTNTNTSDNTTIDATAKEILTKTTIITTSTILPASVPTVAAATAATPAAAIVVKDTDAAAATTPTPATAVTIDAIMAAATADEDNNYNEEDTNANDINSIKITNNDNGIIEDNPVGAATTTNNINANTNTNTIDDVEMETVAVTVLAPDDGVVIDGGMEEDTSTDDVAVAVGSISVDESATVENLVVAAAVDANADADATQQPSAADLVVAADAAILLAKTQCENGNKSANEEIAN